MLLNIVGFIHLIHIILYGLDNYVFWECILS